MAKTAQWWPAVKNALSTTTSSEDNWPDIVEMLGVQGPDIGLTDAAGHILLRVTLMRGRGDVISIICSVAQ